MPVRSEMKSPALPLGAVPVLAALKEAMEVNGLLKVPRLSEPAALFCMNQAMPEMLMVTVLVSVLVPSLTS